MVDSTARHAAANAMGQYLAGVLNSFELDEFLHTPWENADAACVALSHAMWYLYCDVRCHHNAGPWMLSPAHEEMVKRWIAFLRTDRVFPTRPEVPTSWWGGVAIVVRRLFIPRRAPFRGNIYWPYSSAEDWDDVLGGR